MSAALKNFFSDLQNIKGLIGRIPQMLAFIGLCGIFSIIIHKFYIDISVIALENLDDFWKAVARYLLTNMAGG